MCVPEIARATRVLFGRLQKKNPRGKSNMQIDSDILAQILGLLRSETSRPHALRCCAAWYRAIAKAPVRVNDPPFRVSAGLVEWREAILPGRPDAQGWCRAAGSASMDQVNEILRDAAWSMRGANEHKLRVLLWGGADVSLLHARILAQTGLRWRLDVSLPCTPYPLAEIVECCRAVGVALKGPGTEAGASWIDVLPADLESLEFDGCRLPDSTVHRLGVFTALTQLVCPGLRLAKNREPLLTALSAMSHLQHLDLSRSWTDSDEADALEVLRAVGRVVPTLRELWLLGCDFQDDEAVINVLTTFPNLDRLWLGENDLRDVALLGQLGRLRWLSSVGQQLPAPQLAEMLPRLGQLEGLALGSARLGMRSLDFYNLRDTWPAGLTSLYLHGNPIYANHWSVEFLLQGVKRMPVLERLRLNHCGIGSQMSLETFLTRLACPRLRMLDLAGNELGGAPPRSAGDVCGLEPRPALVDLELQNNDLMDAPGDLERLVDVLGALPGLTHLNLDRNHFSRMDDMCTILDATPAKKVSFRGNRFKKSEVVRREDPTEDQTARF